jgi:4-hydroxybenzoate polyprenyltransferase
LISLNACLAFLIGFFLVSGVRPFDILPVGILSGLFIFYLFVENIKNLKDIAGDEQDNILTIPVIFGERRGKIITWLLVFIGSFAIPFLIFPDKTLSVLGPVLGALSYFLIVKEDYKEKPVMLLYLISFIVLLSL